MKSVARAITLAALFFAAVCGAEKHIERFNVGGVSFSVPRNWTREDVSGGTLLMAPTTEKDWQANIFVEPRVDREHRTLEQAINDLVPNLKSRKVGFKELSRSIKRTSSGLEYALLEYSHSSQGVPLVDSEAVVALPGNIRVFVLLSTEQSLRAKYGPVFDAFLEAMAPQGGA